MCTERERLAAYAAVEADEQQRYSLQRQYLEDTKILSAQLSRLHEEVTKR